MWIATVQFIPLPQFKSPPKPCDCLVPATKVNYHVLITVPNSLFKMSFVSLKGIVFNTISRELKENHQIHFN